METLRVTGTERLFNALQNMESVAQRVVTDNLNRATERLLTRVRENASLTDHSLSDLADIGHPYSKRRPRAIHQPRWKVHRQSGTLLDAVMSSTFIAPGAIYYGFVGVDENSAPHARRVIFGTSKMVSRDFLTETLRANQVLIRKMLLADLPVKID